jgi:hypothetical protein
MKRFYILLLITIALIAQLQSGAQGCVAIKGTAGVCGRPSDAKGWDLNIGNRFFKSYKHFVGTEEQHERIKNKSNVINTAYELDLTATRTFNNRWSLGITLPVLAFGRSSLYEHDGATRHNTHSFGIGDIRVAAYRWMFDPAESHVGNIQLGLGVKLPTGDYRVQDYFYKRADSSVLGPVDQSIQLGDGGTGITFEFNGFINFSPRIGAYGSFFYLANPREVNGTSTARGGTPSATNKKYNTDVMSVPDVFMTRAGVSYMVNKFTVAGGIRVEALPSKDLIGGSRGFRRPGYIVSVEPSVTYVAKKISYNIAVPYAIKRNRTQSNSDLRRTKDTGSHVQGDAAFADYLVSAGVTFRL